jgi:RNA polymerase sigma-70 factor (ECF subfamily)
MIPELPAKIIRIFDLALRSPAESIAASPACEAASVDEKTFDRLVRGNLDAAHRLAIKLCGPRRPEAAEEVVTESLYRAARSWRTYRGGDDERAFRAWLWRIVVNAFRDQLERNEKTETLDADASDREAGPASLASAAELGEIVASCISSLPPRQREVMVLTAYEGYTAADAAELLGTTENNVRVTLHLAREKLREMLSRRVPGWLTIE